MGCERRTGNKQGLSLRPMDRGTNFRPWEPKRQESI